LKEWLLALSNHERIVIEGWRSRGLACRPSWSASLSILKENEWKAIKNTEPHKP